jgi:hypothetical protein
MIDGQESEKEMRKKDREERRGHGKFKPEIAHKNNAPYMHAKESRE